MYDKDYYCTHPRVTSGKYKMKCDPKVSFVYSAPEWVHFTESFVFLNGWVPRCINSYWRHGMSICQDSWQIRACGDFLASYLLLHFTKLLTMYYYRKTWFPRIGREQVNSLTYFPETWHIMINRKTKLHYSLEKLIKIIDYGKGHPVF